VSEKVSNRTQRGDVSESVHRHGERERRRMRAMSIVGDVFLRLHPTTVRKSGSRISFTWCMGGLTFFLFLIEATTGALLMFHYRPAVEHAYFDIQGLRAHVPLGLLREVHRWGAHAIVITIVLHMLRVFLTGSYKPPRELNWCVGVILLVLTLLMSFTGLLLPWDQSAFWTITAVTDVMRATPFLGHEGPGATLIQHGGVLSGHAGDGVRFGLLGGTLVGPNTLLRFYVLHCVLLPVVATVLMAVHFWRIRKDGGISGPL
jgi:quinol-cytochrome oxidoreductase complex cytochrome b subunit